MHATIYTLQGKFGGLLMVPHSQLGERLHSRPVYNLNPQIVRMGPQYKITNQINYPNQIPH